ncbi:Hypothetical predicted protein [Mytilus galloprovincialis]|uniref:Uncharacterized protein n=1 Tax=Mytilus galloprovincialis TaxID=29158 RepID=A0A8B6EJQ2_MYTGA|nr:Hypothetical predicted protein [Mytilus galloprovincialis]
MGGTVRKMEVRTDTQPCNTSLLRVVEYNKVDKLVTDGRKNSMANHAFVDNNDKDDICDVPLMMFLLKYVGKFQILDYELPGQSDTTIDADLTRINYYTQFIVENQTRSLDTTAMNDIWYTVTEVSYFRHN